MSGRTISGVVAPALFDAAQQAAAYEGMTTSAVVSAALGLYLGLPASARRLARHAMACGTPDTHTLLLDGCARAIAVAADQQLAGDLAARGEMLAMQDCSLSEDAIEAEAVAAVKDTRAARRAEGGMRQVPGR